MTMSDFEHLKTPRKRTDSSPERLTPVHVHVPMLPSRWRIILALLAFIVATLCFVTTFLLIQRAHTNALRDKQISDLACQVQRLGGEPVDNVHCPPKASPSPSSTSSPTPHKSPSAHHPPTFFPGVSGGSSAGPTSSRATTQPTPSRSPSAQPSRSPRPSSSPTPSSCANVQNMMRVCLTPLTLPGGFATFLEGGWYGDIR